MSNVTEYKDIVAFHPGYYVADVIEDMGITQAEFATRMGTTTKTLSCLINGQANISNDLAKKLASMMGTGSEVWLNLQTAYNQKLIEIQMLKDLEEQSRLTELIDYKYFVNVVGLPIAKTVNEKTANLCKYLRVSDLRTLLTPDFLINYRTGVSCVTEKNIINSKAWVQTAINISNEIETNKYDAEKLKFFLTEIRGMTNQKSEEFLPRIKDVFAECGVAFVMLPHLKNSGVNGAVKWINDDRVVLAMNNRRLYADIFWFSLFHEIKHVLQRKTKTTFISYSEKEKIDINTKLEDEANKFAADFLIPPSSLRKFSPSKYTSDNEIVLFAESIGIHPGIVAGRLQHEGILPPNRCSELKEKYNI